MIEQTGGDQHKSESIEELQHKHITGWPIIWIVANLQAASKW